MATGPAPRAAVWENPEAAEDFPLTSRAGTGPCRKNVVTDGASLGSPASALYGAGAAERKDVVSWQGGAVWSSRQLREAGLGDRRRWFHVGNGAGG